MAISEQLHPADLLDQAYSLDAEADELQLRIKELTARSTELKLRARRIMEDAEKPREKPAPPDPLLAAAGLAVGDLGATFLVGDLAAALAIPTNRATTILIQLEELNQVAPTWAGPAVKVAPEDRKWRALDPFEADFRDAACDLGSFSPDELAGALDVPVERLSWYLAEYVGRGILSGGPGEYGYVPPDAPKGRFSRPKHRPPEKEPPAGTESRAGGKPVMMPLGQAARRQKLSQPGVRLQVKNKERNRKRMEDAREQRAEQQRARAKANPQPGRRKKAS